MSGGGTVLSCDEAAAMALHLLLDKAQLCTDQLGKHSFCEHCVVVYFCSHQIGWYGEHSMPAMPSLLI